MTDSEEYKQLKEDEKKIYAKIIDGVSSEEEEKLYRELGTIRRRKYKLRERSVSRFLD